jgi:hypothetical protein
MPRKTRHASRVGRSAPDDALHHGMFMDADSALRITSIAPLSITGG